MIFYAQAPIFFSSAAIVIASLVEVAVCSAAGAYLGFLYGSSVGNLLFHCNLTLYPCMLGSRQHVSLHELSTVSSTSPTEKRRDTMNVVFKMEPESQTNNVDTKHQRGCRSVHVQQFRLKLCVSCACLKLVCRRTFASGMKST